MHHENIERAEADDRDEDDTQREAVTAADDTGMVLQHEILVKEDFEERGIGEDEPGA